MSLPEESGVTGETTPARASNPRAEAIAQIGEASHQQRMAEVAESESYFGQQEAQPQDTQQEHGTPEASPSEQPAEQMVEIKVFGETKAVPLSEVIEQGKRTLQKETAADRKLQEASELLRAAQEQSRRTQPPQENYGQSQDQATGADDEFFRVVDARVENRVREVVSGVKIQERFLSDFPEFAADQRLMRLAVQEVDQRRSQGDTRNDYDFYKEVGQDLRKWRGIAGQPDGMQERKERKEAVQTLPTASARQAAPKEAKEPSVQDIIRDMRKARHQATGE